MDVTAGAFSENLQVAVVCGCGDYRVWLHVIQHLYEIVEKPNGLGHAGLGSVDQCWVTFRNCNQVSVFFSGDIFENSPYVVMIQTDNSEAYFSIRCTRTRLPT